MSSIGKLGVQGQIGSSVGAVKIIEVIEVINYKIVDKEVVKQHLYWSLDGKQLASHQYSIDGCQPFEQL